MENRIRFASVLSVLLLATRTATAAVGVWDGEVVVPIVLTSSGLNGSFFTSELTLTNRGTTDAALELSYTSAFGGGTGVARDTLAAGRQKIVPN
ncbi:MAG: hypothetical protein JNK60_12300, partial [Acidobacteria bacterium]|nr:hypothetical protein [Acidobacteriota bacterium]